MLHPLIARRMNRQLAEKPTEQLSPGLVDYVDTVIRGLHAALQEQTEPPYRRPEHPVDGWGLTTTPLEQHGEFAGKPTVEVLGHRALYLSTKPNRIWRVLTAPHPRKPFEERVIQIRSTSVPYLLKEDPSLYYGLLDSAEAWAREPELDYSIPPPTLA